MDPFPYSNIAAIDPGASGAAVVWDRESDSYTAYKHVGDITMIQVAAIADYAGKEPLVVLEKVHASPIQGVSSAFAFGENFGAWRLALKTRSMPVHAVTPQEWQKAYPQITGKGKERKRRLKELAQSLFPDERITLDNCDAYLLARWARNQVLAGKPVGKLV